MTPTQPLAHLTEEGRGHGLREHLQSVGIMGKAFAAAFDSGDWGFLAGLWHDLGKYAPDFQAYIRKANGFEAHLETIPGTVDHFIQVPGPSWHRNDSRMPGVLWP